MKRFGQQKDLLAIAHANKQEFPDGKVEDGESPEHCLKREIKERFGMKCEKCSKVEGCHEINHTERNAQALDENQHLVEYHASGC